MVSDEERESGGMSVCHGRLVRAEVCIDSVAGKLGCVEVSSGRWRPHSRARCPGHTDFDAYRMVGVYLVRPLTLTHGFPVALARGGDEGAGSFVANLSARR